MNNLTTETIISTLADAGQPMPSRAIANALGIDHIGKVRALLMELVHDETVERAKGGKYQLRDAGTYEAPTRSANVRRELLPTNKAAIKAREKRKVVAKPSAKDVPGVVHDKQGRAVQINMPQPAKWSAIRAGTEEAAKDPAEVLRTERNASRPLIDPRKEKAADDVMLELGIISPREHAKNMVERVGASMNVTPEEIGVEIPNNREIPEQVAVKITTLEDAEQAADEEKARDQRIRDAVQRLKSKMNFEMPLCKPVDNLEFKIEILDGIGSADADLWVVLKEIVSDLQRLDEISVGPF